MNEHQIRNCRTFWLPALRSGEYDQGKSTLKVDDHTFCCLGVACVVTSDIDEIYPDWIINATIDNADVANLYGIFGGSYIPFPSFDVIPPNVPKGVLLKPYSETFSSHYWGVTLAGLNDDFSWTFHQISQLVERCCFAWEDENESRTD